jgi:hypothetical protein
MLQVLITVLAIWFTLGTAFNIPTKGLFSGISELEGLVTSRAVFSTITQQVKNEIISDTPFMRDISHGYVKLDSDLCYLALIGVAIYSKMNQESDVTSQKLKKISMYSSTMKKTRAVIFTLIVILTKNVDNAI